MFKIKNKVIKNRIMAVVDAKIEQAQAAYEKELENMEVDLQNSIARLHEVHENAKSEVADKHVNSILGKLF